MKLAPLVMVALGGTAHAGATFEFNIGGGIAYVKPKSGDAEIDGGSSQPHFSVGAKLSKQLAVVGRLGLFFPPDRTYFFLGGGTQYWVAKRLFIAGGLGVGSNRFDKGKELADGTAGYRGLAFDFRIGGTVYGESHRLTIQLEAIPTIYPNDFTVGILLLGGYQYW